MLGHPKSRKLQTSAAELNGEPPQWFIAAVESAAGFPAAGARDSLQPVSEFGSGAAALWHPGQPLGHVRPGEHPYIV
jgi:hypothetical protein